MKKKIIFTLTIGLLLVSLLFSRRLGLIFLQRPIYLYPPTAQQFVQDALFIMSKHGIYSKENNFDDSLPTFIKQAQSMTSLEETLPLLNTAAIQAGGYHSYITKFSKEDLTSTSTPTNITLPHVSHSQNILTIYLPAFTSNNEADITDYINQVKASITAAPAIKGIILDLRNNTGGNMTPMFGAVSQLLPDGKLLDYVDNNLNEFPIELTDKQLIIDKHRVLSLDSEEKIKSVPIAILTNQGTASAAEVLLVAFKGQPLTKQFGMQTAGRATGVAPYKLYQDYYLALAGVKLKDLQGNIYEESPILADTVTDKPEKEAEKWLKDNIK